MTKHSVRATIAIISAVCAWLATLLNILMLFGGTSSKDAPMTDYTNENPQTLDFDILVKYYKWLRAQTAIIIIIDLLGAVSFSALAYVVLILKRVLKQYRQKSTDLPMFMVACFFIGAILPCVQFLTAAGFDTMSANMSNWPTMQDPANPFNLQSLYIAHELVRSSMLYLWALMYIFVPVGLFLAALMTFDTRALPIGHGVMGVITSISGIFSFIMLIISYNVGGMTPGIILGISLIVYSFFCLPIWTVWLGHELRKMKKRGIDERQPADAKLPAVDDTAY